MGSLTNPSTPIAEFFDSAIPLSQPASAPGILGTGFDLFLTIPVRRTRSLTSSILLLTALSFLLRPVTPDDDGLSFDIQLSPTQTAACVTDAYDFVAVLTQAANVTDGEIAQQVTLVLQSVIVEANLATATGPVDTRSFVKKTLDIIKAAIAGDTRPDVQEYMIQGRQLRKIPRKDLETLLSTYEYKYRAELRASGEYTPSKTIGFRFTTSV